LRLRLRRAARAGSPQVRRCASVDVACGQRNSLLAQRRGARGALPLLWMPALVGRLAILLESLPDDAPLGSRGRSHPGDEDRSSPSHRDDNIQITSRTSCKSDHKYQAYYQYKVHKVIYQCWYTKQRKMAVNPQARYSHLLMHGKFQLLRKVAHRCTGNTYTYNIPCKTCEIWDIHFSREQQHQKFHYQLKKKIHRNVLKPNPVVWLSCGHKIATVTQVHTKQSHRYDG